MPIALTELQIFMKGEGIGNKMQFLKDPEKEKGKLKAPNEPNRTLPGIKTSQLNKGLNRPKKHLIQLSL
jgi:hypothetical protein